MILAPIAAEYLSGYDDTIGRPLDLLANLLIFIPLYGTVAVLIREVARRAGRGWPSILLLGLAFGIVQAGLIDQSLFNTHYRGIPSIENVPTIIPGLGFSASLALNFSIGHMIWSFAAPIAVVEASVPDRATRPWLGWAGLTVVAALYILTAIWVFRDQMNTEHFLAAPAQLGGAAALAVVLAAAAFAIPHRPALGPGWVPPPWLVTIGAAAAFAIHQMIPPTWYGVAIDLVVLALLGGLTIFFSRREAWGERHVLVLAGSALVVTGALSFVVQPLGNPPPMPRYAVNATLTLGMLILTAGAFHRLRSYRAART